MGRRQPRHRRLGGRAGDEPAELDPAARRQRHPFDVLQAEQIAAYHAAWAEAGWDWEPRVSVSRSVLPIASDEDRRYFGSGGDGDQVGYLDGALARFGNSYTGEPDAIAAEIAATRPSPPPTPSC